ncbi:MAG: hypothetical protein HC795_10215, partial [Coleofasciculaceae cyanobacterium RL_1_1]|nr:hypothetical protein [Coleofasciculaceae cyanobacterium RL_1_1]
MKNAVIPKIDGLALGKAAALLAAIAVAGFGVVPVIFADPRPQTETIAPPSIDPNWLLTPEPAGLDVAREQADLFANEIHRTLIQSEAARIVSKAHSMVGDPAYKDCYGKSIERCFDSIEQSVREEWLTAIEHDEKIRVLFRWQALQVARTGNVEPPVMALDGTFLQLSDKLAIERNAAMNSSVEGASRFRQIESQLERLNTAPSDTDDSAAPPSDGGDRPTAPTPPPTPTPQPQTPSPTPVNDPESDSSGDQNPPPTSPSPSPQPQPLTIYDQ